MAKTIKKTKAIKKIAKPPVPCSHVVTPAVCAPERTQGLAVKFTKNKKVVLVKKRGPGVFVSAEISKQGGSNDITFVDLTIDGKNVVNASYAALYNWGLTGNNPYGVSLMQSPSGIKTVTIGFNTPLYYKKELRFGFTTRESGLVQIIANVITGR